MKGERLLAKSIRKIRRLTDEPVTLRRNDLTVRVDARDSIGFIYDSGGDHFTTVSSTLNVMHNRYKPPYNDILWACRGLDDIAARAKSAFYQIACMVFPEGVIAVLDGAGFDGAIQAASDKITAYMQESFGAWELPHGTQEIDFLHQISIRVFDGDPRRLEKRPVSSIRAVVQNNSATITEDFSDQVKVGTYYLTHLSEILYWIAECELVLEHIAKRKEEV